MSLQHAKFIFTIHVALSPGMAEYDHHEWSCNLSILADRIWNESGFRPPLCTYRLNWARRTSWGWWDDWDDTPLRTQDSKFEPWRSEAELPLGHGGSPQYWLSHVDGEETFFVSFKPPRSGTEPRTLAWKAAVLTTTLGPPPLADRKLSYNQRANMAAWSRSGFGAVRDHRSVWSSSYRPITKQPRSVNPMIA